MTILVMTELFHVVGLLVFFGTSIQALANTSYLQDTGTGQLQRTKRHTMGSIIHDLLVKDEPNCITFLLALQEEYKQDSNDICQYLHDDPSVTHSGALQGPIKLHVQSFLGTCTANDTTLMCEVNEEHNEKCCEGALSPNLPCPKPKECSKPSPTEPLNTETLPTETSPTETSSANISGPYVMLTIMCMMVIFCLVKWLEEY